MMSERVEKITKTFEALTSWEDRYKKIIEIGKRVPDLDESKKTEEAKVRGCQSQVWLHASLTPEGTVIFEGDSDALLVKGLVGILLEVFSGAPPAEILAFQPDFLKALGFEQNLSPSRTNGLFSMIKQIKNFAVAFDYMLKMRKS